MNASDRGTMTESDRAPGTSWQDAKDLFLRAVGWLLGTHVEFTTVHFHRPRE